MKIDEILKNFTNHGFKAYYFKTVDEAKSFLENEIHNTTIGIGGSMTFGEMGLYETLSKTNKVFCHTLTPTPETVAAANDSEVYMLSANALSETGEIINIDGKCNRISAAAFGLNRKRIVYVCGTNKLAENIEKALWRAKNIAAPMNARRLARKTPCALNADKCYNCNSPERICRSTVITTRPSLGLDVYVVIVEGKYGY